MSSRTTLMLSALTTALLTTASAHAAGLPQSIGAGEGQLNIIAWPGYIENGSTDKAYDWVTAFACMSATRSGMSGFMPRLLHTNEVQSSS